MEKRAAASIIKKIRQHEDRIAKERDKLREFISDLKDLAESCDSALDSLECAVDDLSKFC